jgi:short-subunit dehydrogenase
MAGRVALITGASSGIGYASALAFAREGTDVAVTARRADRLAQLQAAVDALPEPRGKLLAITADVTGAAAMQAAVAATVARFGRLDVLVANAGVGIRGALADADWADAETLLRTNIDGVIHSIRAAVPALRQSGGGYIIIISSVTANMPSPYTALYGASKAFVSSLARSLATELAGDQIIVADMRVGRTQTEFSEKRLGKSGRATSGGPSSMSADRVAEAVVRASRGKGGVVALRWVDRLIMLANTLAPGIVARFAVRQYR